MPDVQVRGTARRPIRATNRLTATESVTAVHARVLAAEGLEAGLPTGARNKHMQFLPTLGWILLALWVVETVVFLLSYRLNKSS